MKRLPHPGEPLQELEGEISGRLPGPTSQSERGLDFGGSDVEPVLMFEMVQV